MFVRLPDAKDRIMKNKGLWSLLAFLLVVLGISSVVMQMVGVQWVFLNFLEIPGRLFAFIVKVLMVFSGIVLFVLANTDWDRERRDSSDEGS